MCLQGYFVHKSMKAGRPWKRKIVIFRKKCKSIKLLCYRISRSRCHSRYAAFGFLQQKAQIIDSTFENIHIAAWPSPKAGKPCQLRGALNSYIRTDAFQGVTGAFTMQDTWIYLCKILGDTQLTELSHRYPTVYETHEAFVSMWRCTDQMGFLWG